MTIDNYLAFLVGVGTVPIVYHTGRLVKDFVVRNNTAQPTVVRPQVVPAEVATTTSALPAHDPMDWRVTVTSDSWDTNRYCENCFSDTNYRDHMSGICSKCGSKKGVMNYRSTRSIWNGDKWVKQHKYGDGPTDFTIQG